MSAPQIDMHRFQEAVRFHHLGNSQRSIVSKWKMGRDTLRSSLWALEVAHLLGGAPGHLPGHRARHQGFAPRPQTNPSSEEALGDDPLSTVRPRTESRADLVAAHSK